MGTGEVERTEIPHPVALMVWPFRRKDTISHKSASFIMGVGGYRGTMNNSTFELMAAEGYAANAVAHAFDKSDSFTSKGPVIGADRLVIGRILKMAIAGKAYIFASRNANIGRPGRARNGEPRNARLDGSEQPPGCQVSFGHQDGGIGNHPRRHE